MEIGKRFRNRLAVASSDEYGTSSWAVSLCVEISEKIMRERGVGWVGRYFRNKPRSQGFCG